MTSHDELREEFEDYKRSGREPKRDWEFEWWKNSKRIAELEAGALIECRRLDEAHEIINRQDVVIDSLPHVPEVVMKACGKCKDSCGYYYRHNTFEAVENNIGVQRHEKIDCSTCDGSGKVPVKCEQCNGEGRWGPNKTHLGTEISGPCQKCYGTVESYKNRGFKSHGYATKMVAVVPGMEVWAGGRKEIVKDVNKNGVSFEMPNHAGRTEFWEADSVFANELTETLIGGAS